MHSIQTSHSWNNITNFQDVIRIVITDETERFLLQIFQTWLHSFLLRLKHGDFQKKRIDLMTFLCIELGMPAWILCNVSQWDMHLDILNICVEIGVPILASMCSKCYVRFALVGTKSHQIHALFLEICVYKLCNNDGKHGLKTMLM